MAVVPVEILCVGHRDIAPIDNAISFLNKQQDVFVYSLLRNEECETYKGDSKNRYTTTEIYRLFDSTLPKLKGYHPHVVGVVKRRLDGEKLGNLFGSMQESENNQLTGKAITSLHEVKEILYPIPLEVYLIFEFLSFAIRFVAGQGLIHNDRRICFFDKKIFKPDIIEVMKNGKFCDDCQKRISGLLDNDQMIAINRCIRIISDICVSKDPQMAFKNQMGIIRDDMPKIFLSYSRADKDFVERLAKDLVNNDCRVWFDKWEIKITENIVERINSGIKESDYLALILSKSSVESPWVRNEWTAMFIRSVNEKRGKILPILIEDCEIPPLLLPFKYVDFRDPKNYNYSLKEILNVVKKNGCKKERKTFKLNNHSRSH